MTERTGPLTDLRVHRPHAGARRPVLHDAARRSRRRRHQGRAAARRHDARHAALARRPRGRCDYGGYFASINRNKRSIVLDLRKDADREVFFRLVETADAVVENSSAGVMDRLGVGYETLRARNPRIVYGAIRGFGDPAHRRQPVRRLARVRRHRPEHGRRRRHHRARPARRASPPAPASAISFPGTLAALGIVSAIHRATADRRGPVRRRRHVRRHPRHLREPRVPVLVRGPRARAEGQRPRRPLPVRRLRDVRRRRRHRRADAAPLERALRASSTAST